MTSDDIPAEVDVAIPRGVWTPRTSVPVRWRHFDSDTFELGRGRLDVDGAHGIGIHSAERSIIDAFRMRHLEGAGLANEALKRWLRVPGLAERGSPQRPVHPGVAAAVRARSVSCSPGRQRGPGQPRPQGRVLLAAFASRRSTRDVDLAGLHVVNDSGTVPALVRSVLLVEPSTRGGIEFLAGAATAEVIREQDDHSGVRVHVKARLASADLPFHVDVDVGDPIWPSPTIVAVPRPRAGQPIQLSGYPINMVLAEKLVTALPRGTANTRWRDFGDIWTLSRQHPIVASDVASTIEQAARHRDATIRPLAEVLDGFADLGQTKWSACVGAATPTSYPSSSIRCCGSCWTSLTPS